MDKQTHVHSSICNTSFALCRSNPQNLPIGELLGTEATDSPFWKILDHHAPPQKLIMVSNIITALHDRLWCVLEGNYCVLIAYSSWCLSHSPFWLKLMLGCSTISALMSLAMSTSSLLVQLIKWIYSGMKPNNHMVMML